MEKALSTSLRLALFLAILVVTGLVWRAVVSGVAWLLPIPIASAVIFAWLVRRSKSRLWADYAIRGMVAGLIIGSVGLWAVVRFTGYGSVEGWEDLIAVVYGMMGGFLGAIVGGIAGAAAGLWVGASRVGPAGEPPR